MIATFLYVRFSSHWRVEKFIIEKEREKERERKRMKRKREREIKFYCLKNV